MDAGGLPLGLSAMPVSWETDSVGMSTTGVPWGFEMQGDVPAESHGRGLFPHHFVGRAGQASGENR
jgi:hypothetical protein